MTSLSVRIAICLCTALFVTVTESRQPKSIAEEWQDIYGIVYKSTSFKSKGADVLDFVMFLHTRLDHVRQIESVTQTMIDNVEYSYERLSDINTKHCTTGFIDAVRDRVEQIRKPIEGNLEVLFKLIHQNLVEICGVAYEKAVIDLGKSFDHDTRIWLTRTSDFFYKSSLQENRAPSDYWLQELYIMLRVPRRFSNKEFIEAWSTIGPCKKLQSVMEKKGYKPFNEFAEFAGYIGYPFDQCQDRIGYWAEVVYRCHRLDKTMPELHKLKPKEPNRPNRLMRFFKKFSE